MSACQNNILFHFHYSTCVEETAICNGTSVCDDQKDLQLCKNETRWKNTTEMAGYHQCKGSGQWIDEQIDRWIGKPTKLAQPIQPLTRLWGEWFRMGWR